MQKPTVFPIPAHALDGGTGDVARFAYLDRFVPLIIKAGDGALQSAAMQAWREYVQRHEAGRGRDKEAAGRPKMQKGGAAAPAAGAASRPADDIASAAAASDFGLIFKERTRIVPAGFTLGEHVMSLSLAPGEEVTLEQKSFTERNVTYEEVNETTQDLDTEMSSTYTTEMSNQLQRQLSETRQNNFEIGGNVHAVYKAVDVTVSPKWSTSLTKADTTTRTESVRQASTQSQKVASKFRAQHKTTMRVSETSRFESSTKRVIRNPNLHTPIDLMYFKVMSRQRMSQERYGVRLCWAPFIPDPGAITETARSQARQYFESMFPLSVPAEPRRPDAPGRKSTTAELGWPELAQWGFWGDMRHDYEFTLAAPANYEWDGSEGFVSSSIEVRKNTWGGRSQPNIYLVSAGSDGAGGVKVRIHAGADAGGPGARLYVNAQARFVETSNAPPDPAYVKALEQWEAEHSNWVQARDAAKAERDAKVEKAFGEWSVQFWSKFDPASAAMQLLVSNLFPAAMRDESWEVDAWTTYFEFDAGSIRLYPGWWSDRPPRDPQAGPMAFQNASWARVFLPIRPGYEAQALTWLVDRRLFTTTQQTSAVVKAFVKELEDYRSKHFGSPQEVQLDDVGNDCPDLSTPFLCMGTWEETLPTDGTHLEVLQANTTALDDYGKAAADATQLLQQRRAELLVQQGTLTDGVAQQVGGGAVNPSLDIVLNVGSRDESGT